MKKLLLLTLLSILFTGCSPQGGVTDTSSNPKAYSVLEEQGYTNIELGGHAVFGCSEDDSVFTSYSFEAMSQGGIYVDGTVCCGLLLKGCTTRL